MQAAIYAPSSGAGLPTQAEAVEDVMVEAFLGVQADLVGRLQSLLGHREDALDMAQEAFVKCWRSRGRSGAVKDLRAWIYRVGLNAGKDLRRSAWHRRARLLGDEEGGVPGREEAPGQALEEREQIDQIWSAVCELRPQERDVFLLRHRRGLTFERIAAERGRPVGTVKTQMRSAIQKLRQRIA